MEQATGLPCAHMLASVRFAKQLPSPAQGITAGLQQSGVLAVQKMLLVLHGVYRTNQAFIQPTHKPIADYITHHWHHPLQDMSQLLPEAEPQTAHLRYPWPSWPMPT